MDDLCVGMNRTPAERLKQLRIKKGYETAKEAARAFGWSEVTYRSHENGIRNMPYAVVKRYALAYGVTPQHILGDTSSAANGNEGSGLQIVNQVGTVHVLGTVSAGTFRYDEFGGGQEIDGVEVPVIPRKGMPASVQYAVLVDGPSVNLRIADGMYAVCVFYDKYPGGAQHGNLVHVVRENAGLYEHTIKELRFTDKGRQLFPTSDDPRYQEVVQLNDGGEPTVRIHGVVIGQYRPM